MRRLLFLVAALALACPALSTSQDPPEPGKESEVGAPLVKQWQLDGYGGYFTVRGTPGGATVTWSIDPRPRGLFFKQHPGAHSVAVGGPPGRYVLTATVTTWTGKGRVKALPKGWKEGDVVPFEITELTVASVQTARHEFTLVGGDDPVPPGPGPTPTPPEPKPPEPKPPEPKPPEPKPDANPFPGTTGLHVLIVYEDMDKASYPPAQLASWTSQAFYDYMRAKGAGRNWRVFDKDTDASEDEMKWNAAMGRASVKAAGKLPWIMVGNGASGYEGPTPANTEELLKLLKRFGGE